MTAADGVKSEVAQILFDIESMFAQLSGVKNAMYRVAQGLNALQTEDLNVLKASAAFQRGLPDELENGLVSPMRVVALGLQDFVNKV